MSNAVAALAVSGLKKCFGSVQALGGLDLEVEQGAFFGLLGPNGAGKTTLISIMAGLARPDAGSVRIMGHDVVQDYRQARMNLGLVPQELVFDPFFSVRELLRLQSGYFGLRKNDDWIDEILHSLDLTAKADANMRTLSGGMKRRVLVAQALVHRPPLIVLDEPTAGVDVQLRLGLWTFVRRLNEQGHTIVLTTHYLEEAQALCGRIAMLKAGKIVALDSTRALLHRFASHALRVRVADPDAAVPLGGQIEPERSGLSFSGGQSQGRWVRFGFERYAEIEACLARLREANIPILDLEMGEPDLEQVFVEVMEHA
jgi:ABC-2 type transport system ATP-binding protein